MRFISSFIFLFIFIAMIIIPAYMIAFLDIAFIGRGTAIQNIQFYLLAIDPNMPREERVWNAEDLQQFGIKFLLIYLTIYWFVIHIIWIFISEFLKVDRPNKAFKYIWLWIIFLSLTIIVSSIFTYYLLYSQKIVYMFVGVSQIATLVFITAILSGILCYVSSLFITSRVMRPAIPLANIIMRF